MDTNLTALQAAPLGKSSDYIESYQPALLFPLARAPKRAELGLLDATLPFVGEDEWNGYELSWLNPRGKPVVALVRFVFPANSPNLVESKSFKLYLNSFNQSPFEDEKAVEATLARDLSAAAGEKVKVHVTPLGHIPQPRRLGMPEGSFLLDTLDVAIETYQPSDRLLSCASEQRVDETLYSHLLKSNCPVTGQPDWGRVAIRYVGPQICREGLLRYIVSFRRHQEFHEQCVERMFIDMMKRCRPEQLCISARYTRRGGLDINPLRATPGMPEPLPLFDERQ